ncbi:MAG: transglutaminase TgpA family protein [Acidothermaceae bacterium]
MSGDSAGPIAGNSRAIRIALLVAGLAGQFALQPLVSVPASVAAAVAMVAVAGSTINQPLIGARLAPGHWWDWQWRQVVALLLIVVSAIVAVANLRVGASIAEARTLAVMLLLVQVAHAMASGSRREAALGCCVVLAMFSVAAVFSGDITLLLPIIVGVGAIAVVVTLLHRGWLLESADGYSAGSASTVVRSCLGPVAVAVGVAVAVFLAMPNSSALHGRHNPSSVGSGAFSHGEERARDGLSSGAIDLRARGPLSNAPALSTPAAAPQYWQGAIYDDFDGTQWRAARADYSGLWPMAPQQVRNGLPAQVPPAVADTGAGRTDDVTILASDPLDLVFSPGTPTAYWGDGRVVSDADAAPHLIYPGTSAADTGSYAVSSTRPVASDADLRSATEADPQDPRWTTVSASIAPRVRQLAAQLTKSDADRFDKVESVEDYLRTNEKYDLNSPEPARGDDAVDDFVFVSHRGFCEQFATAAIEMLRSVGVPARMVTGYAFGDTKSHPGQRIFLGTDAHAWVQVYYPGIGWVDSDPTASGSSAPTPVASQPSVRQQIVSALSQIWHRLPGGRTGALVIACVVLLLGIATAFGVGRWWSRRSRRRLVRRHAFAGVARAGPALAAYLRLEAALADDERAREPGETLGEFGRRLGGLVASAAEVRAAMRMVELECYARESRRPSDAESAAAAEVFERLRAAVGREPVTLAAGEAGAVGAAGAAGVAAQRE